MDEDEDVTENAAVNGSQNYMPTSPAGYDKQRQYNRLRNHIEKAAEENNDEYATKEY